MNRSPKKPWSPGVHTDYSAFRLRVNICQDQHRNVWSDHDYESRADQLVAESLPQGGVPQIAHALLTEAVRREAFVCALVELSRDAEFLKRYQQGDAETRKQMETKLQEAVEHVLTQTMSKMIPGSVAGVLDMMNQ